MQNRVKYLRTQRGLTQSSLAEATGLSLRTIQRVESGQMNLKGHTLITLATFFKVEPSELKAEDSNIPAKIRQINLSALLFIFLPILHLILPIIIWKRNKGKDAIIDEAGKQIINFQILWSLGYTVSLILSPFLQSFMGQKPPLILVVILIAYLINFTFIGKSAVRISRGNYNVLPTPLRLI